VRRFGTVDTVLHKELDAFTSFEFDNPGPEGQAPEHPVPAGQAGNFIDPRAWSSEADWPDRRSSGQLNAARDSSNRSTGSLQRDTIQEMPARSSQAMSGPPPFPQGLPVPSPMAPNAQLLSQPVQLPTSYAPTPLPPGMVKPAHRGVIFAAMAVAVVLGAILAYLLFSGR